MLSFELDQDLRRLDDLDLEALEAFVQRGRTLQARAMGRGLKALFRTVCSGRRLPAAATERGKLDWERVLGLSGDDCRSARGA